MSLSLLPKKEQAGSRPRCVLLTEGPVVTVAARLTELVGLPNVTILPTHLWTPCGFAKVAECQLDKDGSPLVGPARRLALRRWWLSRDDNWKTPTWDLVSQATIGGRTGLVLFEAKAHVEELVGEEGGKRLEADVSEQARANHEQIGRAIAEASADLTRATGAEWRLSRDNRYQMSNRFAWAWRVAREELPVVLVYLGFMTATEMATRTLIDDQAAWERAVLHHAAPIVPSDAWGREIAFGGGTLTPVIRAKRLDLPA